MSKANVRSRAASFLYWTGFTVVLLLGVLLFVAEPPIGILSSLYVAASLGVSVKHDLERYRASKNAAGCRDCEGEGDMAGGCRRDCGCQG